jgi:hypothetical protein
MRDRDRSVPCYNCDKRSASCHSSCEDYRAFTQARADRAKVIQKQKAEDRMVTEVRIRSIIKTTKEITVNRQRAWKKG